MSLYSTQLTTQIFICIAIYFYHECSVQNVDEVFLLSVNPMKNTYINLIQLL